MASGVVQDTHCIGRVLSNGHLEIPTIVIEQMGLKQGDEVVVALQKATSTEPQWFIPPEARDLVQELVGTPQTLNEAVEGLTTLATQMIPAKKQQRLSHLLWKNQNGNITTEEEKELDALVAEGQEAMLCKAKAILALKYVGVDIIPDLEKSATGKLQ